MSCDSPQPRDNNDLEAMTSSLSQSYEEIALLHRVSDGMRVTQQPQDLFSRLLPDVLEVINAEKLIIFWRGNNEAGVEPPMVASVGALPLSRVHLDVIWDRSTACASREVQNQSAGSELNGILIDSDVDRGYSYEWPKPIRNIVSIPIRRDQQHLGVLVALNKIDKPDFDSIDMKLLISVGNEIAVFLENFRLYHEMQELFLGSLRALSNSIDAKDTYTCGHSERVAFICRYLAEKLSFDPAKINNVYLAGLLHDIGKIGVSEAVLCKPGRLTDDEFAQIKKHPQIGADILKSIRQMEHISRIILSHHERFDGGGYPNGLSAGDIPIAGRIVMLADSFDSMIADRTYRKALPVAAALAEIRRYSGTQFDPRIAESFLDTDIDLLVNRLEAIADKSSQKYNIGNRSECFQLPTLN